MAKRDTIKHPSKLHLREHIKTTLLPLTMLFKSLRRGSKSSTTSTSNSKSPERQMPGPNAHPIDTTTLKTPAILTTLSMEEQKVDEESRDFQLFLEKTKLEEERRKRAKVNAAMEAERRKKACNMSPWAGRM